jgi:hypothetical protein
MLISTVMLALSNVLPLKKMKLSAIQVLNAQKILCVSLRIKGVKVGHAQRCSLFHLETKYMHGMRKIFICAEKALGSSLINNK